MKNTRIHQPRPLYESWVATISDPAHPLYAQQSVQGQGLRINDPNDPTDPYYSKYMKYKQKYLKYKLKLSYL